MSQEESEQSFKEHIHEFTENLKKRSFYVEGIADANTLEELKKHRVVKIGV